MIAQVRTSPSLPKKHWSDENHLALAELLEELSHSPARGLNAVFDWDFTCAFQDTQDFVLRHLVRQRAFRFSREFFDTRILPRELSGKVNPTTLTENDFVRLYQPLCQKNGLAWAYRWCLLWLVGYRRDELQAFARKVIQAELRAPLNAVRVLEHQTVDDRPAGLRIHEEMRDLAHALRAVGVETWIVTASSADCILPFACDAEFGYGFRPDRIIGNAALTGFDDQDPGNWGPGKAESIRRRLASEPIFAAGDSDGDFQMLTEFPSLRLGLVIERENPNRLSTLATQAPARPRLLFQRRDFEKGTFKP